MKHKHLPLIASLTTLLLLTLGAFNLLRPAPPSWAQASVCTRPFVPVATPLNDLGANEYRRGGTDPTGFTGGLYPNGSNTRPSPHETAGVALAQQIVPLDTAGNPDPNGQIVMISVGMSNAFMEFRSFKNLAETDPDTNPQLVLINGAQPGQVAQYWTDPNAPTWITVTQRLTNTGLTPQQVQIAWIKQVRTGDGSFPGKAEQLQADLEAIVQSLLINYPNVKLAYLSSRTRSYVVDEPALSPEPAAYESGFAVKWLIEKQINGADLNYNPANGPVVAPYLSWGPYLWIDGLNPRSDGRIWEAADMVGDCTHPSDQGEAKVAAQLLHFFQQDTTTYPWFNASGTPPSPNHTFLPTILKSIAQNQQNRNN